MRDLLFFTFFYLCLRNTEFQDKLQTGRSILVFGNDLQLKLCQTAVVWSDPASQGSPHHLLPSPGQPTRLCWQPWSPCLHISWQGVFVRPPEFSSQLMSYSLFCHQVGSKEMLWGGICQKTFPGLSACGKIWLQEKGKISQGGSAGSGILCVCSSRQ